jgi:hypothetical protein
MSRNQAPSKHAPLPAHVPRKPTARSRLTNQIGAILHGDARSVPARRYRDVVCALVADAGGPDHLTEMQIILIRRVAGLTVIAESAEADLCNGAEIDIKEIALIASTLTRLGTRVGLKRTARDITPSLDQYVQANYSTLKLERAMRATIGHDDDEDDDD